MERTTSKLSIQDEQGVNQVFASVGSAIERKLRRHEWFAQKIKEAQATRVLEIGCGTGEMAHYLATHTSAHVTAIDLSPSFIEHARASYQHSNLKYEQLNFMDFSSSQVTYDFVCGNGILHHLVKQLPEVLKRLRDLAGPQGSLAFIEPNILNPYCAFIFGTTVGRRFAKLDPDEMAFSSSFIARELRRAGWSEITVATRDFLVPGLPASWAGPIKFVEPALEATALTSWLAQSNFIVAKNS